MTRFDKLEQQTRPEKPWRAFDTFWLEKAVPQTLHPLNACMQQEAILHLHILWQIP